MHAAHLPVALVLLAALSAQAQTIERVKLTDNDLSCQAVYDEIRMMETLVEKGAAPAATASVAPDAAAGAAVMGAVAQQAAVSGGFSGFGGFGSLLGGLAQAAAGQQAAAQQSQAAQSQQQAALALQAQGRKEHLTALFLSKGCKTSDLKR